MRSKFIKYLNQDFEFDRSTWIGIFCLIIVISGVFGWLYEVVFYFFNSGMTEIFWRGGNFSPWINIYAIGSIAIFFLTYKKRKNLLFIFLVSAITCGILEYIAGWGMDTFANLKCWDYSSEIWTFGNLNGYVCTRSVVIFGISALLLIYGVVPLCFYLARHMNKRAFLIISYTLCTIILIDELYNLIFARIFSLPRASTIYKKIGFHYLYF